VEPGNRNKHWEVDEEHEGEVAQDSTDAVFRGHRPMKSAEMSKEESAKILLRLHLGRSICMKSTGWTPKRTLTDHFLFKMNLPIYEFMLCTDDYWLEDILYRACGITVQSTDCASSLQFGKFIQSREFYV